MSLFNNEFYPTPENIIAKMVAPYADRLGKATILEPSAGNGAILDYILDKGLEKDYTTKSGHVHTLNITADKNKVYSIEKNVELQYILQEKGYRLVAADFLGYWPDTRFDLILMNPPFDHGDSHLLHAWEILKSGDIACLLNAETIRNPYTAGRKRLAKIIEQNGTVEELGKCFAHSEHPTDVEVVLVRLHKESNDNTFSLNLEGMSAEAMPDFASAAAGSSLEQSSRLDPFLASWDKAKQAAIDYIKARETLRLYLTPFINPRDPYRASAKSVIKGLETYMDNTTEASRNNLGAFMSDAYNHFVDTAKKEVWNTIFNQMNIDKYMTSNLRDKLYAFRDGQSSMAVTKENIQQLVSYIMLNISDIMDASVAEVYDMFTRFFSGNTSCNEGWKTNKRYSCNRKVILPNAVECGDKRWGYHKYYSLSYSSRVEDIDKAMCWLTGRSYDSLTGKIDIPGQGLSECPKNRTIYDTIHQIEVGDQNWHESAFFRVKAFKKGTLHLEFKDEALWAKFNQVVNKEKNIIGDAEAA